MRSIVLSNSIIDDTQLTLLRVLYCSAEPGLCSPLIDWLMLRKPEQPQCPTEASMDTTRQKICLAFCLDAARRWRLLSVHRGQYTLP